MAAEDTDKDTKPSDPPSNDDNDIDIGEKDEWKPPTKEEWEKTQRALTKANAEAKDRRERLKELQQKTEDADGKKAREAAEEAEKKFKPLAIRSAAKAAFLEAGLQNGDSGRVAKLIRMLDLDSISIDDDGEVLGLTEQVKTIKADYPELFATQEKKPPRVTTGDKPGTNGRPKRSSDLIAAQVLGR